MKLLSLHLENYRRFHRLDLEFPDGVVAIVGRNGSGKSTLTESIAWALYGNKPEIVRAGKESLKWTGAPKGEGVKAVLRFKLDEQEYALERTLKDASLLVEGKLLAKGTRPVEEKISDLLHMEYKEFSASIYARQKELNLLSQQRPEDRKRLIHRLLGITAVEDARNNARKDRLRLQEQVKGASSILYRDGKSQLDALVEKRKDLETSQKTIVKETKQLDRSLEDAKKRLIKLESELDVLEKKRGEDEALKKELSSLSSGDRVRVRNLENVQKKISSLEEKKKGAKDLAIKEKEYILLKERIVSLEEEKEHWTERQALEKDIVRLEKTISEAKTLLGGLDEPGDKKALEKALEDTEAKDKESQSKLRSFTSKKAKLEQKKETLHKEIEELETHLEEIARLGDEGSCPTCERPLKGHSEKLEQKYVSKKEKVAINLATADKELASMEGEEAGLERLRGALEKKKKRLSSELRDMESVQKEREMREKEIFSSTTKKEELDVQLKKLEKTSYDKDEHIKLKKDLKPLEKAHNEHIRLEEALAALPVLAQEKEELETVLAESNKKKEELDKAIEKLAFNKEGYAKLSADRRTLANEERALAKQAMDLKTREARNSASLESLEDKKKELEAAEAKIGGLQEEIEYLLRLAGARSSDPAVFSDFLTELTNRIRPLLRTHSTELFNLITENRYGGLELNDEYSIGIYDSSAEPLPLSRFSGGEEDVANLCLRIAVSRALSERSGALIDHIILDEIFGSQDSQRRENILRALDKLSSVFRQVFVITHIDSIKESVGYVIRVEEKEDGSSTIVVE